MVTISIRGASHMHTGAVATLRRHIEGDVYLPHEEGFDAAIHAWAALTRHTPTIAVVPETSGDVAHAVSFADRLDLPVAVQGTGHGMALDCADGMLVNTSRLQGVSIDPERRVARVQAGVKWEKVIPLAHAFGLAPLNGASADVGVLGYTLGGGHGWLARKYGRAADRVMAADIVTANGEMLRLDAASFPDLFWAIRGGSGNFGIVTSLEFGLVPVTSVYGGTVMYPLEDAPRVFRAFSRWTRTVPDDITATITILRLPSQPHLPAQLRGARLVAIRACAVGDLDAGQAAIAPMRQLATPVMDTFRVLPYSDIGEISHSGKASHPTRATTMMLRDLEEATIGTLMDIAGPDVDSPLSSVEIRDYRGLAIGPNPGPGNHDGLLLYVTASQETDGPDPFVEAALAGVREAMRPHALESVLLNMLGDGDVDPERTRACFTAQDYDRLRVIKRRYDPSNRFRFNHNIAP